MKAFSFTAFKRIVKEDFQSRRVDIRKPNAVMWSKIALYFSALFVTYLLLLTQYFSSWWMNFFLIHLFPLLIAATMLNVLHDMVHGSFIQSKLPRALCSYMTDVLGASHLIWYTRHNICHHTHTNDYERDVDIQAEPLFRFAQGTPRLPIHRFQQYYAIVGYALYGFLWFYVLDFEKFFTGRVQKLKLQKFTPMNSFLFLLFKALHIYLGIVLPYQLFGLKAVGIYFYIISLGGLIIGLINQLAHVFEGARYHSTPKFSSQDAFALTQIGATSCFAPTSKWNNWLFGGINHQLVHHLFPDVPHCHHPRIFLLLQDYAAQTGVRLHVFKNLKAAVNSHWTELGNLGKKTELA